MEGAKNVMAGIFINTDIIAEMEPIIILATIAENNMEYPFSIRYLYTIHPIPPIIPFVINDFFGA